MGKLCEDEKIAKNKAINKKKKNEIKIVCRCLLTLDRTIIPFRVGIKSSSPDTENRGMIKRYKVNTINSCTEARVAASHWTSYYPIPPGEGGRAKWWTDVAISCANRTGALAVREKPAINLHQVFATVESTSCFFFSFCYNEQAQMVG